MDFFYLFSNDILYISRLPEVDGKNRFHTLFSRRTDVNITYATTGSLGLSSFSNQLTIFAIRKDIFSASIVSKRNRDDFLEITT